MGQAWSRRDMLQTPIEMVSPFIMDFASGSANIPHHHDTAEEVYFHQRFARVTLVAQSGQNNSTWLLEAYAVLEA